MTVQVPEAREIIGQRDVIGQAMEVSFCLCTTANHQCCHFVAFDTSALPPRTEARVKTLKAECLLCYYQLYHKLISGISVALQNKQSLCRLLFLLRASMDECRGGGARGLYFPRRRRGKTQKVKLILTVQSTAIKFFAKQDCAFCLHSSVTASLCCLRNAQAGTELLELRLCSIGL